MVEIVLLAQQESITNDITLGNLWTAVGTLVGVVVTVGGTIVWIVFKLAGWHRTDLREAKKESQQALTKIESDIQGLVSDVTQLKIDTASMTQGVTAIGNELTGLRGDTSDASREIAALRGISETRQQTEEQLATAAEQMIRGDPYLLPYRERKDWPYYGVPMFVVLPRPERTEESD